MFAIFRFYPFPETNVKVRTILEEYAKINPIHADVLLSRAEMQEKKRALIENRSDFMLLVDAVNEILTDVETELTKHDGECAK